MQYSISVAKWIDGKRFWDSFDEKTTKVTRIRTKDGIEDERSCRRVHRKNKFKDEMVNGKNEFSYGFEKWTIERTDSRLAIQLKILKLR